MKITGMRIENRCIQNSLRNSSVRNIWKLTGASHRKRPFRLPPENIFITGSKFSNI